jgi:hypothetical protein
MVLLALSLLVNLTCVPFLTCKIYTWRSQTLILKNYLPLIIGFLSILTLQNEEEDVEIGESSQDIEKNHRLA